MTMDMEAGSTFGPWLGSWNLEQDTNPSHSVISIHFLHANLSTSPMIMTTRICLTIKFLHHYDLYVLFKGNIVRRKEIQAKPLGASALKRIK